MLLLLYTLTMKVMIAILQLITVCYFQICLCFYYIRRFFAKVWLFVKCIRCPNDCYRLFLIIQANMLRCMLWCVLHYIPRKKWLSKHPLVLLHVEIMQRWMFCPTLMWIIKKFLFDTAITIKFIKLHKIDPIYNCSPLHEPQGYAARSLKLPVRFMLGEQIWEERSDKKKS